MLIQRINNEKGSQEWEILQYIYMAKTKSILDSNLEPVKNFLYYLATAALSQN